MAVIFFLEKEQVNVVTKTAYEAFEKLKSIFSEAQIIEIISAIRLFNYINRFNNIIGILPE